MCGFVLMVLTKIITFKVFAFARTVLDITKNY